MFLLYVKTFMEGLASFLSPCLLPLVPVYLSYFAGGNRNQPGQPDPADPADPAGTASPRGHGRARTIWGVCGFMAGFTPIYMAMGAFAGWLGTWVADYPNLFNGITGAVVMGFGLAYLGVIRLPFLDRPFSVWRGRITGFLSAFLFGLAFAIGWSPCVTPFLAAAVSAASRQGSAFLGMTLMFSYAMGMGLPFLLSALAVERCKTAWTWVKRHYLTFNRVSGVFLLVMGILMFTGLMGRYMALWS